MRRLPLDPVAVVAAALALVMAVVYLAIMRGESDDPVLWFLAMLILGAVGAGYGATRAAPHRTAALVGAGVLLTAAGVLGILSIGLPILVAGVLSLIAAAASTRQGTAAAG